MNMMDLAPGWQVRCLTCGLKIKASDAGIIRLGAVGKKYTLGRCSRCNHMRCLVVENAKPQAK